jgi:Uma2 family endonuclease
VTRRPLGLVVDAGTLVGDASDDLVALIEDLTPEEEDEFFEILEASDDGMIHRRKPGVVVSAYPCSVASGHADRRTAMAAPTSTTGLVYEDLASFPDDGLRRELIQGELIVTPAPRTRHQQVVARLVGRLLAYMEEHGGEVLPAPVDVLFSRDTVLQPDVLFVNADHVARVTERFVEAPPDLVVEVSSPSTRHLELVRKREVYERFSVPEYWFVDLDAERIEVYRLAGHRYGPPLLYDGDDEVAPTSVPGFTVRARDVLGPWG